MTEGTKVKEAHTSGPWGFNERKGGRKVLLKRRLIAAAPEMLEALKLVDAFAKAEEADGADALWTDHFREVFEVVRAAIAKATGARP